MASSGEQWRAGNNPEARIAFERFHRFFATRVKCTSGGNRKEKEAARGKRREGERQACKRTKEREVCTRACALWSPVGLPFNRWLDSPTHSFIHTRCTRFESISKPRKRISPIGLLARVNLSSKFSFVLLGCFSVSS